MLPPAVSYDYRRSKPRFIILNSSLILSSDFSLEKFWGKLARVSTVPEISQAIEHLDVRDQMRLLHDLPAHLKIQPDDVAWLKAAEPAFEFWNNPEDAIYDEL